MAISLYRKYRPNTFADVVGQEHVENTLTNAVASGDVAHAYLFCGPRGTGKTTSARLLAKALLCEHGPTAEPDGTCPQCLEIAEGTHPDVYELDAASRTGVENVREEIISRVHFAPTRGRYKVYIIDEVHMLTSQAFNALLKTLEEPPAHVIFIMCTTDPHKVLETIQSRCQRFDFRRLSIEEICTYLERICVAEGFTFEREALEFIAAKAAGGMRDATTSLEQVAVASGGQITLAAAQVQLGQTDTSSLFELGGYLATRDTANAFLWLNRVVEAGSDLGQVAHDLADHMRNLYVAALTGGANGIIPCSAGELPRYQQQAAAFGGPERLGHALTSCGDLVVELRHSANARLSFEVALARLCRAESELTLEALAERIESLEAGIPAPKIAGDLLGSMAAQAVASASARVGVAAAAPQPAAVADEAMPELVAASVTDSAVVETLNVGPTGVFHPGIQHIEEEEEEYDPYGDDASSSDDDPSVGYGWDASAAAVEEPAPAVDLPWDADVQPAEGVAPFEASSPAGNAAAPIAESAGDISKAEPQSQAVEPVAAATPAANMSPARLMAAIRIEIKRDDVATDALLNGVVIEQDASGYHLVFPVGGDFAMKLVSHGTGHDLIGRALKNVLGAPVAFDFRTAGGAPQSQRPVSFGSVSATEAAAPTGPDYDDGYLDAQSSYVDSYADNYGGYDDYAPAEPEPAAAPVDDFGDFNPAAYTAEREAAASAIPEPAAEDSVPGFNEKAPVDAATANNLADTLSVFGGGIKFEEV